MYLYPCSCECLSIRDINCIVSSIDGYTFPTTGIPQKTDGTILRIAAWSHRPLPLSQGVHLRLGAAEI